MATLASRINSLASAAAAALKAQRGVQAFCGGKPGASELLGVCVAPYAMTLSTARSNAVAVTAATARTEFAIKVNGTQAGTLVFSPGATAAVATITTPTVAVGAVVSLVAPATQDATLADISFGLRP